MQRQMLKSKIHRATITDCDVEYVGSVTLDPELMRRGDKVIVASFAMFGPGDLERYSPIVVHVDDDNSVTAVDSDPSVLLGGISPAQEALL